MYFWHFKEKNVDRQSSTFVRLFIYLYTFLFIFIFKLVPNYLFIYFFILKLTFVLLWISESLGVPSAKFYRVGVSKGFFFSKLWVFESYTGEKKLQVDKFIIQINGVIWTNKINNNAMSSPEANVVLSWTFVITLFA